MVSENGTRQGTVRSSTFAAAQLGSIQYVFGGKDLLLEWSGPKISDRPTYRRKPESLQGLFRWGGTFRLEFRPSSPREARALSGDTEDGARGRSRREAAAS